VRPAVSLTLKPDDSLTVESELVTPDVIVVEKPSDLRELQTDEGWYAAGDDLFRVVTTDTALDKTLIEQGGNGTLSGEEVPKFLKLVDENGKALGEVDKNDVLKPLSVFGKTRENRAKVDGNADAISVVPLLVVRSPGGDEYEQSPDELKPFAANGGGFSRVDKGWVEVGSNGKRE